jgi:hypothetical protein
VEELLTLDNDDARMLAAISRELPPIDVDATTGEQIARRARQDVGKGRPARRWILPIVAAVVSVSYLVWTLLKMLEVFG